MKNNTTKILIRFVVALIPFALFGIIYDSMRYYPNYLFNSIDTEGVYNMEKTLFGISTATGVFTPNEYFNIHNCAIGDLLSGIFYLLWVPLPILYGIYLFFSGQRTLSFRFACAFLFVNLVGFAGYYVYPASPPWYVLQYGFEPILNTPGNVGGFARFDELIGFDIFHNIYCKNANVFAAIPSLHSAYNPIALFYAAFLAKRNYGWIAILSIVSVGIWWAAVYSCHHYIIDVTLGVLCVVLGIALFEGLIMNIPAVRRLYNKIGVWME